ncbi:MAG: signal recognition particle receptor subunit alpha, partial [Acidobacteriota bacterium]
MVGILGRALDRTRERLADGLRQLLPGRDPDAATLEALEEALIYADVGPQTSADLVDSIRRRTAAGASCRQALHEAMLGSLTSSCKGAEPLPDQKKPWVGLLVGVNGSGKTTTAAKLAARFRDRGC